MSGGLINGYSIAAIAAAAYGAQATANSAYNTAASAYSMAAALQGHRHSYVAPATIVANITEFGTYYLYNSSQQSTSGPY